MEIKNHVDTQGQRRTLAFTHGHWDHVRGVDVFPGCSVWVSPALYDAVTAKIEDSFKNQQQVEEFDSRWYVQRNQSFQWPHDMIPLRDGNLLSIGDIEVQSILLPGHSNDGLGFLLSKQKVLIVGDYLSACKIPFVDQVMDYRQTLNRFLSVLPMVTKVIPGHGPCLSASEAKQIILEDLAYIEELIFCAQKKSENLLWRFYCLVLVMCLG